MVNPVVSTESNECPELPQKHLIQLLNRTLCGYFFLSHPFALLPSLSSPESDRGDIFVGDPLPVLLTFHTNLSSDNSPTEAGVMVGEPALALPLGFSLATISIRSAVLFALVTHHESHECERWLSVISQG